MNGATEATLYISAATNFVNYHDVSANESKRAATYLQKATRIPYEQALKSHIASYRKQYDRVALTLESTGVSALETPVRVQRFMEGNDMAMAALMFCPCANGGQGAVSRQAVPGWSTPWKRCISLTPNFCLSNAAG